MDFETLKAAMNSQDAKKINNSARDILHRVCHESVQKLKCHALELQRIVNDAEVAIDYGHLPILETYLNSVRRGNCPCILVEILLEGKNVQPDPGWLGGIFDIKTHNSEPYEEEYTCVCRECRKSYAVSSQPTRNDVEIDWKMTN